MKTLCRTWEENTVTTMCDLLHVDGQIGGDDGVFEQVHYSTVVVRVEATEDVVVLATDIIVQTKILIIIV